MGWSGLGNIDDVEPMGEADRAVMDEVRQVLAKHGALERFGLTLLHSHFDLAADEILVETVDVERRMLTVRPVPQQKAVDAGDLVPTSWRLDRHDHEPMCGTYCHRSDGVHACSADLDAL